MSFFFFMCEGNEVGNDCEVCEWKNEVKLNFITKKKNW